MLALTACGGGASSNAPRGTVLTVARVKDAVILDPSQASDGMSLNVTQEIMKGLLDFKLGTFEIEPAIAQSWSMSPDGMTWTFTLKHGLSFSDGTPIDADAVKFNFDRWRLISSPYHGNFPYPYYATMFGGFPGLIADVRAPKPDTVVFTLTRPFAPFLHDLAMPSFAIGSPKAIRDDLEGFGQHPIGYGPYTLSEWVKDDHITLTADPKYPVKPVYQTVIIRDIPDQSTAVLEMEKGDVDILTDPRPDDAAMLAKAPGLTVFYQPANNNSYLAMNLDRSPFEKLGVRQAIAYAVDVRGIVKAFYPQGALVADNWTPPGMMGENPAVKAYPYDLAKAKALLASAGYPNGFSTELFYPTIPRPYMPEPQRVAEAIQAQLKKIGIDVTLDPFEWGVFLEKVHNGEHAMCLIGWSGDNGDPDNFMYTLLDQDSAHRPNAQNYSFWRDPQYHRLMIAGQVTADPVKRAAIYRQANALIHEMVPSIPIVHVTVPIVVRSTIGGFVPSPDTHIAFEYLYPKP
ncbi:MAG TPA: ABC transporter substrate-binding protein [Verrucomicrobiae bacterium]|nr:ABC transporter substrate-binding protein [Verrucomicrobiae bacterium]